MYEYKAKVVKVIDGDTIDVDIDLGFSTVLQKRRIRLYGIDTPESRTRDKEEKQRGILSKKFLLLKCPIGGYIKLKSHGVGKFGRILGELFEYNNTDESWADACGKDPNYEKYDGSINQEMCDEGYAVPYFGQSKEEIIKLHQANKQILIAKGLL